MNYPSIKAIHRALDTDFAVDLRKVIDGTYTRNELNKLFRQCSKLDTDSYNTPALNQVKLMACNEILSAHGLEYFLDKDGYYIDYVNMGDTYVSTVLYYQRTGRWYVMSYGDFIETKHSFMPKEAQP